MFLTLEIKNEGLSHAAEVRCVVRAQYFKGLLSQQVNMFGCQDEPAPVGKAIFWNWGALGEVSCLIGSGF